MRIMVDLGLFLGKFERIANSKSVCYTGHTRVESKQAYVKYKLIILSNMLMLIGKHNAQTVIR